ncbi:uncharacterized protein SPPG_01071 [Spizellomyces punctatus DAOM BR117]|uniref:MPN domain-containing protein n=1 Tax=Spizellomyces punctatus (strain DAOM BR117) TaxID=645134 RepID=A0A0L0HQD8_SPIPD|nr:uncharacterized protein SPPG_01071 [Spizellomyces punctatus DAOM BR117]KND03596.1 hypothetical protein SPPG_01071 [Spizellomyces punctatus DAOM BR117]|eukprot:XP_016611635.1 hypothetical protein SPPG_01071 [Spizellomyces punctatus DAOM BR117]
MALSAVHVSAEVHMLCLSYSLCTEKEETLALLLGTYYEENGKDFANVDRCLILTRKDKRKDRVEISDEQLSNAIEEAEATGTKVVGWSHSHPHITVFPSHVDLNTQRSMQLLDNRFFGLIFSCFNTDSTLAERIQVTCFQAGSDGSRISIPLLIMPRDPFITQQTLTQLVEKLPTTLLREEREAYDRCTSMHHEHDDDDTHAGADEIIAASFHGGLLVRSLALLLDRLISPLVQFCVDRHERNLKEIQTLKESSNEESSC